MSVRLFVAVRPPDAVLDAVEEVVGGARRSMVGPRWTGRDQWHVTLRFLGHVEGEQVGAISQALDTVSRMPPFPVRLGGGGAFPRPSRARVVWLGLVGGDDPMTRLAGSVNGAVEPLGFEPEKRDFHPHLTLARLRDPGDVTPAVEALGDGPVGPAFTVEEVVLYESRLSRKGARYEPLSAVALAG